MIMLALLAFAWSAGEPAESELSSRQGNEDVIPAYFRGTWATSQKSCNDEDAIDKIVISESRIEGYESDAKLLKIGGVASATGPKGATSYFAELLVAESGEGRVNLGTIVLSRVGEKLYPRRKDTKGDLTEAQQYQFPNIRCSSKAAK